MQAVVENKLPLPNVLAIKPIIGGLIVVGTSWAGRTIASAVESHSKKKICGFVDDIYQSDQFISFSNGDHPSARPVLGHSSDLFLLVKQYRAKGVIIAHGQDNLKDHLLEQMVKCYEEGIPVYEMCDLYARLTKKIPVHHLNHKWFIPQLSPPVSNLTFILNKTIEYIASLLGFIFVLVPLYPLIALAIKVDSEGPVLFKQKRVGKNGRPFTLYKFRTMRKDAHINGTAWTIKKDWRITRIGRWLRKFRLDEIPQILNILKRDMSLIGPRPEAVELVEMFKKEIPFYEYRYLVRPGITGWAQVNYENTCSVEGALEKLQYDLYWIKNRSLWIDLKIIFKSIQVMLTGYGAV